MEYKDAKNLNCFANEENIELNKLKEYQKKHNINNYNNNSKELFSLSKIKIINLLYQLNDYFKLLKDKFDYKNLISGYKIKFDLKFKLPNYYGSYELQYYTLLKLFIFLFGFELEEKKLKKESIQ